MGYDPLYSVFLLSKWGLANRNASTLGPENILIELIVDPAIENLDAIAEGAIPALNS